MNMLITRMYRVWADKGSAYFFQTLKNEILKKILLARAKFRYDGRDLSYYGQYGEDLIIDRLLGYKENGFYVDVGANHPERFSNTKKFYDRGWRGINIDPSPICFELISTARVKDCNLCVGISSQRGKMSFYDFEENTISTFSKETADKLVEDGYKIREKIEVDVITLSDVFEKSDRDVDFLSVDAEGFTFDVLKSNDWSRFQPKLICLENEDGGEYGNYLKQFGYKKVDSTSLNSFYMKK